MIAMRIGTPERLIRAAQEELIHSHGLLEMQAMAMDQLFLSGADQAFRRADLHGGHDWTRTELNSI